MANKSEVKMLVNSMANVVRTVGEIAGLDVDAGEGAKSEIAMFMMYLSASDGEIKWEEASWISEICDLNLNPQTLGDFIRGQNIYSIEFENKVPTILKLVVEVDNKLIEMGMKDEVPDGAALIIDTYKNVGIAMMESDGNVDDNEENDFKIYIDVMESFVSQNSMRRKQSTSGFTKNTGGVVAPAKSGVSAPKKG